jgi:hypothetical protein
MFSLDGHSRIQCDILNSPVDDLCLECVGFDEAQFSFNKQIPTSKMATTAGCAHDVRQMNVRGGSMHSLSQRRAEWNGMEGRERKLNEERREKNRNASHQKKKEKIGGKSLQTKRKSPPSSKSVSTLRKAKVKSTTFAMFIPHHLACNYPWWDKRKNQKINAWSGNRTRVYRVAGGNYTTKPTTLLCFCSMWVFRENLFCENFGRLLIVNAAS